VSWSLSSESIPFINHFCASSGDSTLCVATRSSFALLAVISVFGAFVSSGTLSLPSAIHNIVKNPAVASHVFLIVVVLHFSVVVLHLSFQNFHLV